MTSTRYGEPWFSRNSMALELKKHVIERQTSNGRTVFYGENGEDLRLKQPGFDWSLISEKRREARDSFKQQFTSIFGEFCEKITGKDKRSQRKSSITPILPSTKTPGLTRHKPRTAPIPESSDQATEPMQISPPELNFQKPTTPKPTPTKPNLEESASLPMSVSVSDDVSKKPRKTRVGRKKATQKDESQQSDEEYVPTRPTRRLTRQQARAATKKNPEPTPSVRTRRTRARKSPAKKASVETEVDTVCLPLSVVGVESQEVIKVTNNRFSRELSVSRTSRGSSCQVSVEKLSLSGTARPQTDSTVRDNVKSKATPTFEGSVPEESQLVEDNGLIGGEPLEGTKLFGEIVTDSDTRDDNTDLPGSPNTIGVTNHDDIMEAAVGTNAPSTPSPTEPDGDVEMSLARPTPPRRKALNLKLRKKGTRKPAGKPVTRAAKLRHQSVTKAPVDDISDGVNLSDHAHTTTPDPPFVVPSSSSADSVYESCASRLGTPTESAQSPKSPRLPTPHTEYKTPPTVTKPTSPVTEQEPPVSPPLCEAQTEADSMEEDAPTSPSAPPLPATPVMNTPSYMTGTPHTLLRLREEYQNRTGGRLVSLTDLLNSGGHTGSSLKKKASKIPQTAKTPKRNTPSKNSPAPSKPVPMETSHMPKTPLCLSSHSKAIAKASELSSISEPAPSQGEVVADTLLLEKTLTKDSVAPLLGGKRLRSVSMERLSEGVRSECKVRKRTSSSEESGEKTEGEPSDSPIGTETDDMGSESGTESRLSVNSPLPSKKENRPKTFLSVVTKKKATEGVLQYKEGTSQPLSFLPRKSPKKVETLEEKKAQLADKILRKRQEEEKRQEDLKNRRQQELLEKIKKREERARKVAEKQAALRLKAEEKKQKLKGCQGQDPAKKVTSKKAKEIEEKNKKLKERMMAAEARRKQEELQQQKRLQQLEDERRLAIELAQKRKEMEEEEKRLKRQEKLKQDKERHLKHMEELREQQEELKRKIEEDLQKKQAEGVKSSSCERAKHSELVKQFEKLIGGAIAKVPVVATPKITRGLVAGKSGDGIEKTNKLLQAYYNGSQLQGPARPAPPPSVLSPADSRLNSTFTKDSPSALKSPLSSQTVPTSYQMTPVDPLSRYDNYDIGNLSSEDSTDDEDHPKKELPLWARPESLNLMMKSQEDDLNKNRVDVTKIFPPEQLLKDPDLGRIFRRRRQRFYQRSSSAHWDSPILKRNKVQV